MSRERIKLLTMTWLAEASLMLMVFAVSRQLAEDEAGMLRMGLVGGVSAGSISVASMYFGGVSDRIGRRRSIFIGVAFMLAGSSLLLSLPFSIGVIAAGYLISGVGYGAFYPAVSAWLADGASSGHGKPGGSAALTRSLLGFALAWNVGIVTGQTVGGELFAIGWRAVIGCALGGHAAIIVIAWLTPARQAAAIEAVSDAALSTMRKSAAFARVGWIANVAYAFAMSMVFHLLPALMVTLDVPADQHGFIMATTRLVTMTMYVLLHVTTFWRHRFSVTAAVQMSGIVGLVLIAGAASPSALMVGLALLAGTGGFNYFASLFYSTTGRGEEARGAATGFHEATLAAGFAIGAVAGGWAGQQFDNVRLPYGLAAAFMTAMFAAQCAGFLRWVRPTLTPTTDVDRDAEVEEVAKARDAADGTI